MLLHSQGSHLALGGHHCRNPAGGKWLVPCDRPLDSLRVYVAGVHLSEPEWYIFFSVHSVNEEH
jgi:hypothetical protein